MFKIRIGFYNLTVTLQLNLRGKFELIATSLLKIVKTTST